LRRNKKVRDKLIKFVTLLGPEAELQGLTDKDAMITDRANQHTAVTIGDALLRPFPADPAS
jgi:hypothetical protein